MGDVRNMTLGALLRRAARATPDGPALLHESGALSWSALDDEVDRLATLLHHLGLKAGEGVALFIHKRPEVVLAFLAAARLGAVLVPVNFKLAPDLLAEQIRRAAPRVALVEPGLLDVLERLGPLAPPIRLAVHGEVPGATPASADLGRLSFPDPDPDSPCYYNYTSGTTGHPKGAVTSHRNIVANALSTIEGMGFGADDVFLGMFSVFSHPHELFHRSLILGGAFALVDSFSPRVICEAIARHRIRWMMAVPSFYEMMLDHLSGLRAAGEPLPDLGSLRVLEAGGAFTGADTVERMEAAFGARFCPVWGSTEATGVALANGPEQRRPGATGRLVPGYELRLVDEQGAPTPPGEVGELQIRGPALASGYIGDPEETAALFQGGWYATRDLVWQDEDGFVFFAGRRSEMLKIGGLRVYPLEVEVALLAHPEVKDAVVVGASDRIRGEVARAVIVLVPGSTLDARALQAWCRERLGRYKAPRLVEFWASVPRLPNGKVDRRAVREAPVTPGRDDRQARS